MSKSIYVSSILIFITLLTGCGTTIFSHRETNPSIQDMALNTHFWPWSKQGLNTFSTTASRRMVLTRIEDWGHRIISCAEPSPDVGEAFQTSISDALKLAIKHEQSKLALDLANTYKREAQTEITSLLTRSQGLQLYRNASHNLCMDRMNDGWVLDDASKFDTLFSNDTAKKQVSDNLIVRFDSARTKYDQDKRHIFDSSVDLIKLELKNIRLVAATAAVTRALEAVEKSSSDKTEADKLVIAKQIEVSTADATLTKAKAALEKVSETDKPAAKKAVEEATLDLDNKKEALKSAKENAEKAKKNVEKTKDYAEKMQAIIDKILLTEVVPTKENK